MDKFFKACKGIFWAGLGICLGLGGIFLLYDFVEQQVDDRVERALAGQRSRSQKGLEQSQREQWERLLEKMEGQLDLQVFSGMKKMINKFLPPGEFALPSFRQDKQRLEVCDYVAFTFNEEEEARYDEEGKVLEESRQAMRKGFFLCITKNEENGKQVAAVFVREAEDAEETLLIGDIKKIFPQQSVIIFQTPPPDEDSI